MKSEHQASFLPDFCSTWSTQNGSETPHPSQTGLTFTEVQVQNTGLEFGPQNWKRVPQHSRDQVSFNGKHSYIINKGLFHPTHRVKTYGKKHFTRIPPKIYCTYFKWQASDTGTLWQYSTNITFDVRDSSLYSHTVSFLRIIRQLIYPPGSKCLQTLLKSNILISLQKDILKIKIFQIQPSVLSTDGWFRFKMTLLVAKGGYGCC